MLQDGTLFFPVPNEISKFSRECEKIPHLTEKMVIDFVNGNPVYKDLLESKKKQGRASRFFEIIDGSNRRREIMLQEHVQHSFVTMTSWMADITDKTILTIDTLNCLSDKIIELRDGLMKVAKTIAFEYQSIKKIEENLVQLEHKISLRLSNVDERLRKIEIEQEINKMIAKWESNRIYDGYPLTAQVFFILDDLIRGERKQLIWENRDTRDYLFDSISNIYKRKSDVSEKLNSISRTWLPSIKTSNDIQKEIISYALCHSKSGSLHTVFSEYSMDHNIPGSLAVLQEQGEVPELMDINDFVREIGRESYKVT